MSRVSLGRFKCRVEVARHALPSPIQPKGLLHTKRWEDREVEVFVDAQALAKWYGSSAHNSPEGRVRLIHEVEIVAVKGTKKKGGKYEPAS